MGDLFPLPAELQQVEYAQLYFHLEFGDFFDLPPLGLLQLRRELLQAQKSMSLSDAGDTAPTKFLLQPPEPDDPLLRKQFKKPAPGFVLSPDPPLEGRCERKKRLVLPVLLVGSAVRHCAGLIRLLERLGQLGLYHGTGQFRLNAVEGEDASGLLTTLWKPGEDANCLHPQIGDLHWWLQRQPPIGNAAELEVMTPMRLLRRGKPLFRVDFKDFFPFLLRRVTSMLACHAGVEPVDDPAGLITLAGQLETISNRLHWADWRKLNGIDRQQDLGGLLGSLQVTGPALADLSWLLQLGRLFQVGKGAAYGAGRYRLKSL